jgi:filamentous hemagglutinin family protein
MVIGISGKLSRKWLGAAMASVCTGTALAAPAGPVVSAGSASYNPATLTVTSTSARTHISWPSFNVAAGEVVKFVQPGAQSSVLNQVFDPQSPNILGGLSSNGSVFFLNNGRVSGSGMNLDLAGALSTSLRLPQMSLESGSAAALAPLHPLTTLVDGSIYVLGEDEQALTRANGDLVLNPGKSVELAHAGMLNLRVELTAPGAAAINLSRLVGTKGETGIFAALFRAPAAARRSAHQDADTVLIASAREGMPESAEMQRFVRYALLYAQMRRETLQQQGGMMPVAAVTGSRMLAAAKSRPSLLPREIELGAPVARPRAAELPAASPVSAATELALATLEPQPIAVAAPSEPDREPALLPALAPPAAPQVVATLEPQPVPVREAQEPGELRALARRLAAAQPVAQSQPVQLQAAAARHHHEPRPAPAVTVVALAQHSAAPASAEGSRAKEVRIERHAPRYFTDYRGAMFFM